MSVISKETSKFGPVRLSFETFFIILAIIGIVIVLISGEKKHSSATGSANVPAPTAKTDASAFATLPPATVPSKTAECSTPVVYQSNGTSGPVTCGNGQLNVAEWNTLAALEPSVMSLGYSASAQQVRAAACTDASNSSSDASTTNSYSIEDTVYQISALYYGWNFGSDPVAGISPSNC